MSPVEEMPLARCGTLCFRSNYREIQLVVGVHGHEPTGTHTVAWKDQSLISCSVSKPVASFVLHSLLP